MTESQLIRLRIAATLAFHVPGVGVAVSGQGRVWVGVALARSVGDARTVQLSASTLRLVVAHAWDAFSTGVEPDLCGLPIDERSTVEVVLGPGDTELPGGIYRLDRGASLLHVTATTLDGRAAYTAATDTAATSGRPGAEENVQISFHVDDHTGITLLVAACDRHRDDLAARHVDALGHLAGRCLTHELLTAVSATR